MPREGKIWGGVVCGCVWCPRVVMIGGDKGYKWEWLEGNACALCG